MAPSRRRGPSGKSSGSTARSSSIQEAERRRKEEQEHAGSKNEDDEAFTAEDILLGYDEIILLESPDGNNTTTEDGKKRKKEISSSTASSTLTSTQEAVVATAKQLLASQPFCNVVPEEQHFKTVCDQRSICEKMLYTRRETFDSKNWEYDNEQFDDDGNEGCLHCHRIMNVPKISVINDDGEEEGGLDGDNNNVQVSCDDCRAYICNDCHWCHEFQANHEIRVCDRCDAYYCRGCDEMDQCDDCGEVVCGSCSTLLSCKFCGGGLCEDCATACGRCGIVLCSRDAKFAVDCDTCRLSYCLVCLASGSKDPCVRCGHRPSKRMEQLVHLRLKSIYKAFKSSSSGAIAGGNSNNTSSSKGRKGKTNDSKKDGGRSQRNKPTTLEDMVAEQNDDDDDPGMAAVMMGASAAVLPDRFCYDLQQNYIAEQQRADAAAEALLAELEEEETAKEQKKSKKKKKKERKNANKQSKPATNETKSKTSDTISSKNDASKADSMSESESADEATKDDDDAGDSKQIAEESKMDPIEKELVDCVNNVDLEGIESILFRLKGVPGRAALRKNAKKALKRLKLELNPPSPAAPEPDRKSIKKTAIPPSIAELSKQMASTKPGTRNEKTSNDNTKGSRKKNGTTRCEAQVEIVSRLVGWMIGKNGQRIRDLMEESGAKIWIDQEKIKGQETRNVYISGNRKSVDHAVILVNDVITNAPPPPGSASNVNAATTAMANMTVSHKPVENQPKAPPTASPVQSATPGTVEVKSVWTKTAGSSGGAEKELGSIPKPPAFITSSNTEATKSASEMQNIETPALLTGVPNNLAPPAVKTLNQSAEVTTEIVTCDVRFVPLLIGKRGWTIKNIQDDSGARVDIDQTVTPRQVRISGSKANVDKAVTMVRDVLSYPHAQLQASSEGSGEGENGVVPLLGTDMHLFELKEPAPSPTKQKLVAASAILEDNAARISSGVGNGDRVSSPPPPVVGDSKTAISAASSLSSTPEPSMASMSKGYIPSHLQNAPLLPPPAEHHIVGNSASQPVARQLLQPETGFGDGLNSGGLWASMGVGPGGTAGVVPQGPHAVNSGQFMSHGAPLHIQQQQGRSLQPNTAPPHMQQHPNHNQNINQQSLFPTSNLNGGLGVSPTYNLYNNDGMPAAPASVATPLRDLMSGVSPGPAISSPPRGPGFIESGSRLWNSGNQAPASRLQPHLSSGFGPTSIGLSSGHNLQSNRSGLDSSMGYPSPQTIPSQQQLPSSNPLSLAANTTSNFAPPGLTNNDDSRMIDSLFGAGSTAPSSNANATNTLLSGLNGLSLPNEGDARNQSGLWGTTNLTESWREGGSDNPNIGNIFSNGSNNQNRGHPQQSRFNWD